MKPAERRLVIAAFLSLFGILSAQALLETARDTLFLTHLPVSRLPWVYLAMAALTVAVSRASLVGARGGRRRVIPVSLLLGSAITAGLGVALAGASRTAVYLLFLWSGVFSAFTVTQIWIAIAETLDLSLAKRLYGRLAAGGGLGAVAGAAAARLLSSYFPPAQLVLLAAAIAAVTALGPALALRVPAAVEGAAWSARGSLRRRRARVVEHPYVKRLVLAALLAAAVSTLLDFSFKEAVAARLPVDRLPEFFASFHLVTSAVSLLVQLFGVGLLVRAAGVARAPLLHPVLLLVGVVAAVLTGGLAAFVLLRGLDTALRSSFHRPSFELLQAPLGDRLRRRAKPVVDALGPRGGQVLAALFLVLMFRLDAAPGTRLVAAGALLLAWALVAFGLGRRYVDLLRSALLQPPMTTSAALPHPVPVPPGGRAFEAVAAALADPDQPPAVRSKAPRALVEIDPERSVGVLLDGLLTEQDGFVRFRILRALGRLRRARPAVALDEDILGRAAVAAVDSAYRYLFWRLSLEDGAGRRPRRRTATWELLCDLLREKEENAIERLFRVLTLRYPQDDFRRLLRALRAGGTRTRAAGRELIDNLLSGPAHTLTLALIDDASDRRRLAALMQGAPPIASTYQQLLEVIRVEEEGGTLASLAAHHAAELAEAPAPPAFAGAPERRSAQGGVGLHV
jgi:AAA family ATP:ADP antiporter